MKKAAWKKGVSSTEIGILIAISVAVVTLGTMIFYNNIKNTTLNSNMRQSFGGGSSANYTAENRDYAASQIDVQTMGAQGLEMMRRKANNMAIELIEATNPEKKANDIAYLSKAIEIITGETHICTYMKEDSEKHCNKFSQYKYVTTLGNALTIVTHNSIDMPDNSTLIDNGTKETCNGGPLSCMPNNNPPGPLPLGSSVVNAIAASVYKDSEGYPTATRAEKIDAIIELTKAVYYDIDKNVALIDIGLEGTTKNPTDTISDEKIRMYLNGLEERMHSFFNDCISEFGGLPDADCSNGNFSVKASDRNYFNNWLSNLSSSLSSSSLTKEEVADIINEAFKDEEIKRIIQSDTKNRAIEEDDVFGPKSASTITNELCEYAGGTACVYEVAEASHTANTVAQNPFLKGCYNFYNNIIEGVKDTFENIGGHYVEAAVQVAQDFVQTADEIFDVWQTDEPTVDKVIDSAEKTNEFIVDVRDIAHSSLTEAKDVVSDVYSDRPIVKTIANAALTVVDVSIQAATYVAQAAVKVVETGAKVVKAIGGFFKKLFG